MRKRNASGKPDCRLPLRPVGTGIFARSSTRASSLGG